MFVVFILLFFLFVFLGCIAAYFINKTGNNIVKENEKLNKEIKNDNEENEE